MRIFVIGASGGIGSRLVAKALARGHRITAQSRRPGAIAEGDAVAAAIGSPLDEAFLRARLPGHDAVVFCLGAGGFGPTTLFSDSGRALLAAMEATGIRRLLAVTGVGAGETRGHGGWLYNHVVQPLFTRNLYIDKDRQEALIAASDLDWTILRPAPFVARVSGPLEVHLSVAPELQLRGITREEVAGFILDALEQHGFIREKPFIGHR